MSVEKTKKEVERREAELKKLAEKVEGLSQSVDALERKKQAAEKALALGDDTKQKEVRKIQDEIDSLRPKLRGFESLAKEAEVALAEARETLARVKQEKETRWEMFKEKETMKDSQRLLDSLPKLLEEAATAYVKAETVLGEMCKNWAILELRGPTTSEFQRRAIEIIQSVLNRFENVRRETELVYLDLPGIPPMYLKPSLPVSNNMRFTRDHAHGHETKRLENLRAEFEAREK